MTTPTSVPTSVPTFAPTPYAYPIVIYSFVFVGLLIVCCIFMCLYKLIKWCNKVSSMPDFEDISLADKHCIKYYISDMN